MPDPKPNTGEPTGNPNPASGPAPANEPNPAAPGSVQTPPEGVKPQEPANPAQPVPLDRQKQGQQPTPGAPTGGNVPLSALQEEREKRQALQQELENVKQYVQQIAGQPNAGTTYPQGAQAPVQAPADNQRAQIDKLWETDPRQAVRAEIDSSLSYYDTVNAHIEAQANQLASKYPDFNNYRTTAMNYIRTLPYEQRGQQGVVELAYMVARGQNVDTILQTREQELMEKFKTGQLAGALNQPAGAGAAPATPMGQVTVTPEQQAAAEAMGISVDDYIANMKGAAA
jgi:tellurite resistance protein